MAAPQPAIHFNWAVGSIDGIRSVRVEHAKSESQLLNVTHARIDVETCVQPEKTLRGWARLTHETSWSVPLLPNQRFENAVFTEGDNRQHVMPHAVVDSVSPRGFSMRAFPE